MNIYIVRDGSSENRLKAKVTIWNGMNIHYIHIVRDGTSENRLKERITIWNWMVINNIHIVRDSTSENELKARTTIWNGRNIQPIASGVSFLHSQISIDNISSLSNLNRQSNSLGLFYHVPLKRDRRDWDWRLRLNDTPNAIGCT